MKPAPFEYRAARTATEAIELLDALGDEAKVLAGGQSLIPMMNFRLARPAALIDINGVDELDFIRVEEADVVIGARVRTHQLMVDSAIREAVPLLADAAALVGHAAIRHRGTIGGSLAHGDSAAELPTAALTLGGEITLRGRHAERRVPVSEFLQGPFMTDVQPGELLTEIRLPRPGGASGWAFLEFSRRHGDFALVGVAVLVELARGSVARMAIGLCGVAGTPIRATAAEHSLLGVRPTRDSVREAAALAASDLEPSEDIHGSPEYRRELASVYVERALATALSKAGLEL